MKDKTQDDIVNRIQALSDSKIRINIEIDLMINELKERLDNK